VTVTSRLVIGGGAGFGALRAGAVAFGFGGALGVAGVCPSANATRATKMVRSAKKPLGERRFMGSLRSRSVIGGESARQ
jgi:hypothetical protein